MSWPWLSLRTKFFAFDFSTPVSQEQTLSGLFTSDAYEPDAMKIVDSPDDSGLEFAYDHTSPSLEYDQISAHEKEHAYGTVLASDFEMEYRYWRLLQPLYSS